MTNQHNSANYSENTNNSTNHITDKQEKIVTEIDLDNGKVLKVTCDEQGIYNAYMDDVLTQPGHDANGIIRYFSHILYQKCYDLQKQQKIIEQLTNSDNDLKKKTTQKP